jgi:hypothetical protein
MPIVENKPNNNNEIPKLLILGCFVYNKTREPRSNTSEVEWLIINSIKVI